jgi:hypothetical protein
LVGFGGLLIAFSIGAMIMIPQTENSIKLQWVDMAVVAIIYVGLSIASLGKKIVPKVGISLWCAVIILELLVMNKTLLELRPKEDFWPDQVEILSSLSSLQGLHRVFSTSYSIPQLLAETGGLQLADGINPLQLQNYWEYMSEAIGYDPRIYSVTLPPYPDGDLNAPRYTVIDTKRLGILNVGIIVSAHPIDSMGLQSISAQEDLYIYENQDARPRAWVEGVSDDHAPDWREVESIEWSPNRITVTAQGPGKLILSELDYPGWIATINGSDADIKLYEGLLRSISLDEGVHVVEFRYRPLTVFMGLGITALTLLVLAFIWWRK